MFHKENKKDYHEHRKGYAQAVIRKHILLNFRKTKKFQKIGESNLPVFSVRKKRNVMYIISVVHYI